VQDRLQRLADAFGGRLAVAAHDLTGGRTVRFVGDQALPTASVIKLGVLATVYAHAHAGTISLDDRIALRAEDHVGGSGAIKELSAGTELTVRDLAMFMVVVSDNMATNLLIDAVGGVAAVDDFLHAELGLRAITLRRKLSFTDPGRGPLGLASPDDLVALLDGLLDGRIVSAQASAEMLDMLSRQQYLDQVPRLFDRDDLVDESGAPGRIAVACKTGMIEGVRADAGVIWLDGHPVTYAVMSEATGDGGLDLDADPQLINAEVGRLLVEHFWPPASGPAPLASHPAGRWAELHAAATA
jgi:beta-lactamase class A